MVDAPPELLAHVEQIHQFLPLNLSEADTRVYLIDPVLKLLGYVGVGDIRREVPIPATKEFMDYELFADERPQAIVEAKAVKHSVTDQASAQCVQYAAVLGVRWCIITNGVTWAIYNAHATGPLADKRVATVHLDGDDLGLRRAWEVLSLFSRQSMAKASPLTKLLAERVIMDELSRPDSAAVATLRKAVRDRFGERVSPQMVVDAIARVWELTQPPSHVWTAGRPIESSPVPEPAEVVPTHQIHIRANGSRKEREDVLMPNGHRVSLQDLIEGGELPPGATLEATTREGSFVAHLHGGEVEMAGLLYSNVSTAAMAACGGRKRNGWAFWTYQGTPLSELRKRLSDRLAHAAQPMDVPDYS